MSTQRVRPGPVQISKKQSESPRVLLCQGSQAFQDKETDNLCAETFHLWVAGRWSDSQRLRAACPEFTFRCKARLIKETVGFFRGIPIRVMISDRQTLVE